MVHVASRAGVQLALAQLAQQTEEKMQGLSPNDPRCITLARQLKKLQRGLKK